MFLMVFVVIASFPWQLLVPLFKFFVVFISRLILGFVCFYCFFSFFFTFAFGNIQCFRVWNH